MLRATQKYVNQTREALLTIFKSRPHPHPHHEDQQPEEESDTTSGVVSSTTIHLKDDFPFNQIELLVQRRQELRTPTSSSIRHICNTGGNDSITKSGNATATPEDERREFSVQIQQPLPPTIDILPNTCGIIRNLQILGIFPTS